jgi:hypothetical protein
MPRAKNKAARATKSAPAKHDPCDACWGLRAIYQSSRSNLRCRWCAPEDWSNTLRGHDPPGRLGRP